MKPEILAPAGTMEALKAAIIAGADAVYLGGYAFGARSFAGNFSNQELEEAVNYAHLYGVKIYVTVNTLVYQEETEQFFLYLDFLVSISVDAFIIQDLGMMDYIRQVYPDMELHASTQMHIHSLEGVKKAEAWGLKRVVLAREMSVEEISHIKKNTNVALEVFVQGALCVSYSGQCLMSSLIGGRSGNRGSCTQCCRMKYQLQKGNQTYAEGYLLSTKDLNTLPYLENLLEIGIDSLKIEGRMKRPEYVYLIVSLYRKAVDRYFETGTTGIQEQDIVNCQKLFHRQFTKGFLNKEENQNFTFELRPNHYGTLLGTVVQKRNHAITIALVDDLNLHDGIRILNDHEDQGGILTEIRKNGTLVASAVAGDTITIPFSKEVSIGDQVRKTTDIKQVRAIEEALKQKRRIPICGVLLGSVGNPLTYTVTDQEHQVTVTGTVLVERAKSKPITEEDAKRQLAKLGDTIYELEAFDWQIQDPIFVPLKELNELRRMATEALNFQRIARTKHKKGQYSYQTIEYREAKGYSFLLSSLPTQLDKNSVFYASESLYQQLKENSNVILKQPRIHPELFSGESLIGEVGSIGPNKVSDFSLNVTNAYTVAFLHREGIKRVTLSYEMTVPQIALLLQEYQKLFGKQPNLEVVIETIPEVMISKYRLLTKYQLGTEAYLVDEKKRKFLVREDAEGMHIYHYQKRILENPEQLWNLGVTKLRIEGR